MCAALLEDNPQRRFFLTAEYNDILSPGEHWRVRQPNVILFSLYELSRTQTSFEWNNLLNLILKNQIRILLSNSEQLSPEEKSQLQNFRIINNNDSET